MYVCVAGKKPSGMCLRRWGRHWWAAAWLVLARKHSALYRSVLSRPRRPIYLYSNYCTPDAQPADPSIHTPFDSSLAPFCPLPFMSAQAVRFVAATAKSGTGTLQLLCHVKPGVSASREGIAAVSDSRIDVCVAAQARDGEANKAVRRVVADALGVAKSDVEVIKGLKSRDKTVAVWTPRQEAPEEQVDKTKALLQTSAGM